MEPGEVAERARRGLSRPPSFGLDPGLTGVVRPAEPSEPRGDVLGRVAGLGLAASRPQASYVQVNWSIVASVIADALRRMGVVFMPVREAVEKIPWARRYYWELIEPDRDRYTATAALNEGGVFIYIPPGLKLPGPLSVSYLVSVHNVTQPVHNIIVVGDGAEADLLMGCGSTAPGLHIGVTEMYLGRGARLRYTMIHNWHPEFHARPYTAAVVGEEGSLEYYYVAPSTGASISARPLVRLGGRASLYSAKVVLARPGSRLYLGMHAVLEGRGASAELVSKTIAQDSSYAYIELTVEDRAGGRGHTDCSTLLLGDARVDTSPRLIARHPDADLSHEAAIGRIDEEVLEYLETRGFREDEAAALIVYGFASIEARSLPENIKKIIDGAVRVLARRATG